MTMVPLPPTAAGIGAIGLVIMLATMAAFAGLIDGLIADPTGLLDASLPRPRARIAPISCALVSCMRRLMSRGPLGALVAFWPIRRARGLDLRRAG